MTSDEFRAIAPDEASATAAPSGSLAAGQMRALVARLTARRAAILAAWRAAGESSSGERTIATSLSRAQFNDHIPAVLDCFAHTIQELPAGDDCVAGEEQIARVCEHGLQRWQQGYQLRELIREWGHLQICVLEELEAHAIAHPGLEPGVMPAARRAWAQLCADGVTESATQYWRLHQLESAGHVHDLELALNTLHSLERARAEAWQSAAHDLRGSVTVVTGAASLLSISESEAADSVRAEAAEILRASASSLHDMLNDLLSLARLEAGREQRDLASFDAAALIRDFCSASQAAALERGLFLRAEGPLTIEVEGDRIKVTRILQNLLSNAIKYTRHGGVSVTWELDSGRDTDRWAFSVKDTGPGIDEYGATPFLQELHNATEVGNEAREASTDRRRDMVPATALPSATNTSPVEQMPGEGVGLTIVKRLCELLDASLELATEPGHGSTFRVILPRNYAD